MVCESSDVPTKWASRHPVDGRDEQSIACFHDSWWTGFIVRFTCNTFSKGASLGAASIFWRLIELLYCEHLAYRNRSQLALRRNFPEGTQPPPP